MIPALTFVLNTFVFSTVIKRDITNDQRVFFVIMFVGGKLVLKVICNLSMSINRVANPNWVYVPPLNVSANATGAVKPELITNKCRQLNMLCFMFCINTSTSQCHKPLEQFYACNFESCSMHHILY